MSRESISVTVTRDNWTITGTYDGNVYITLYCREKPFEVINIWDHKTAKPGIPFTVEAVKSEVVEWIDSLGSDLDSEMRNYMVHTR